MVARLAHKKYLLKTTYKKKIITNMINNTNMNSTNDNNNNNNNDDDNGNNNNSNTNSNRFIYKNKK